MTALALLAPLTLLLARYPQSPDGAEMVVTAVQGGVLHPSGMPLQAWINRFAVMLFSDAEPGYVLSWVSWLGAVGTVAMILSSLHRLGLKPREAVVAAAAYAFVPVVALMSIVPEKYAWLSFTQMLFVYLLLRLHTPGQTRRWEWFALGGALGLALSQHSANVILLPAFLYSVARRVWRHPRSLLESLLVLGVSGVVTASLHLSLLGLRSQAVWPDWGHLETLTDVFHHVVRTDYGVTKLFHADHLGPRVAAPWLLAQSFWSWNLAWLMVPLGLVFWVVGRAQRFLGALLLLMLLPGLGVLVQTAMPAADYSTSMGYQERYPLLVWPLIALLWGVGLHEGLKRAGRFQNVVYVVVLVCVNLAAVLTFRQQRYADHNLVEVWREQARYEMEDFTLFWTTSDFIGFYGVPRASGVHFPLKNLIGLPWYRERLIPVVAPPVARILAEHRPADLPALFRQTLNEGFKIVLTAPTPFLPHSDLMAQAEQTGVLWNFSSSNNALYTKQLIANTLHLCTLLPQVTKGVPENGMYFLWEFLESFKFAFVSAGDFLESQAQLTPAAAARAVAEVLRPGHEPEEWRARCVQYSASMR